MSRPGAYTVYAPHGVPGSGGPFRRSGQDRVGDGYMSIGSPFGLRCSPGHLYGSRPLPLFRRSELSEEVGRC